MSTPKHDPQSHRNDSLAQDPGSRRAYRLRRRGYFALPAGDAAAPAPGASAAAEQAQARVATLEAEVARLSADLRNLQTSASALQAERDRLASEKAQAQDAAARTQEQLVRLRTDMDNLRRRTQKEREELRGQLTGEVLSGFLPVFDTFDFALKAAETATDTKVVVDGVRLIERQLVSMVSSMGLEKLNPHGEIFDPRFHEAVAADSNPDLPDQAISEVARMGWKIGDRCLRAAMVKVNRAPAPAADTPESTAAEAGGEGASAAG